MSLPPRKDGGPSWLTILLAVVGLILLFLTLPPL